MMRFRKFAVLGFAVFLCCRTLSEPGGDAATLVHDRDVGVSSITPVSRGERWEQYSWHRHRAIAQGGVSLVFLGDSIVAGWEGDEGERRLWQEYYASRNAANVGIGGDRIENILWRLDHNSFEESVPKVIVVLAGTNNLVEKWGLPPSSPREIADGIALIVERLRQQSPRSRIIVLGIFPRGRRVSHHFRGTVASANELVSEIDDGKEVFFLDIGEKFLDENGSIPEAIMSDALHLTTRGYEVWAEAMEGTLCSLLGDCCESGLRVSSNIVDE